jgi:hypothetical protein
MVVGETKVMFVMAETTKHLSITQDDPTTEHQSTQDAKPYKWYRGVFFQASVVGFCAFTAPGLWNAMQSVGAGGQQTPYLVM